MRFVLLIALASCAPCDFPANPAAPPNVLGASDDCGFWTVAVDTHLVLGLPVEEATTTCSVDVDDGVRLNADPIFTNFEPDGPRWTFDTVGNAPSEHGTVDIECDDNSEWHAIVQVVP